MENRLLATQDSQPERVAPKSPLRQHLFTLFQACLSFGLLFFTIFFAVNCSLDPPPWQKFTFQRPERSITCLNILSHASMFVLAALTSSVFDMVRWALASSDSGLAALTFTLLGRATNVMGVLYLLLFASVPWKSRLSCDVKSGMRIWGSRRYICFALVC
jgi:hypothetical protein